MERYSRKGGDGCPQLLNLMAEREWNLKRGGDEASDEGKLELSLCPPGGDYMNKVKVTSMCEEKSPLCFGYSSPWSSSLKGSSSFLQLAVANKESSQACCNKVETLQSSAEKIAFLSASVASAAVKKAVPNSSQKRPAPVVGWPPVRSFRKNLASSTSSKAVSDSPNVVPKESASKKPIENSQKSLFVKINMDGIPIGRKVDLQALDSYEKLSSAVDHLFRGLLAAQSGSSSGGVENKDKREKEIGGLLDGTGEYTLVYEDNEGDRMLVGDVPWHMFMSTVKRLRVLRTSELPMLCRGGGCAKQGKLTLAS